MTFVYPIFLWLFIVLLLVLWKMVYTFRLKIHMGILLLIVLSLSRPVQEQVLQKTVIDAKDIIIALDVSYSMKAKDLNPSRYVFAKESILALLAVNPSDNITLIAFTTNPLLLSPPTTDHRLISVALDSLNPEFIMTKGTSLKALFSKVADISLGHKNLVLITDGGEEQEIEKLISLVRKANVSLSILALGSKKGATLQNKDGTLVKDKNGHLVISRINPLLKTLSRAVSGTYMTASSSAKATALELSKNLQKEQHKIQKIQKYYRELYHWPLGLAILLFFLLHTRWVKYLVLFFALFGIEGQASVWDNYYLLQGYNAYNSKDFIRSKNVLKQIKKKSLQSQIILANSYYNLRDYKKSIEIYKTIHSTSRQTKQQLYYNIANAYVKLKSYSKAKSYYAKVLVLGEDEDAKYNLSLIILLGDKEASGLGIAHPKSQNASSSQSETQEENAKSKSEDTPSSGSGGSGEAQHKEKQKKDKLLDDGSTKQQPLGSKVYELINKGYIREKQPW
ncbi:MAG: VWA domain-containing protein [Epsilonproteobacteria bacterium]|nr:MAG: VWA domain-containing protein [Campylobacterota bacterium]